MLSVASVAEQNSGEASALFAWPPWARWLVIALCGLSLATLALLGLRLQLTFLARDALPPARTLWLTLGPWAALPCVLAALARHLCAASLSRAGEGWTLRTRGTRFEIPATARARLVDFRFPFPGPGGEVELASGALLRVSLEWRPPFATLSLLRAGRPEPAAAAWARERAQWRSRLRAWQWLGKWLLLPALLAWPFFNLEQWVEFGGTLGEYYQSGALAWARSFARNASMIATWLLLVTSFWRLVTEALALLATLHAPSRAADFRWRAETANRVIACAAFPLLLLWRFVLS